MFFNYSIGFLAAAGILIPLIIHLWNIKEGKTLKIGSIVLLGESAKQSAKSLKIKDWLLFLLRSLLILLIAFLLAEPFIKIVNPIKSLKGWVLFEKADYANLSATQKTDINLLTAQGFEIHDFDYGFRTISVEDSSSFLKEKAGNIPPLSLIKQLNTQFGNNFKTIIYTALTQNRFKGELPKNHLDLEIRAIELSDTLQQAVIYAFVGNQDSIQFLLSKSNTTKTTFEKINYSPNDKNIELKIENGETWVRFKSQADWIKVINKPLKIDVYADEKQDANYLNSALKAIASFTKMKIVINNIQQVSLISTDADWIFWLSQKAFNQQNKLNENTKLFSYESGKTENLNSFLSLGNEEGGKIYKRIENDSLNSENLWTDGFGNTILSKNRNSKNTKFHFYSRLNPQWIDLVWSAKFPQVLMPILFNHSNYMNEAYDIGNNDKRTLSKNKLLGVNEQSFNKNKTIAKVDLPIASYFWIAAFFIFFLERIITYRQKLNG